MSIVQRAPGGSVLPTHLDLPHTDNQPVENTYQPLQAMVLTSSLASVLDRLHPEGNYYIGADTGIYWRQTQPPERGCRAPDWYYVPNVPRLLDGQLRLSYVLWQEKVPPTLVVEVVSGNGFEERDDTPNAGKFWIYEQIIKAQYYAIWEHLEEQLDVYELFGGRYRKMVPGSNGRFSIPPMGIELGVQESEFFGNPGLWLRGWDMQGKLIPTSEERAESQTHRAEKLAAKLRELGLDPDRI